MKYLLDTHTWLWLVQGVELTVATQSLCDNARDRKALFLAPISLWEIAMKASRKQLGIPQPVREWLKRSVYASEVTLSDFDLNVAVDCADLPTTFHGDPADRILASTCRVQGLTLLTRDRELLKLAGDGIFPAQRI